MLIKVVKESGRKSPISSVLIDGHDMITTFPDGNQNAFNYGSDFIITGRDDFAFLKNRGYWQFCKAVWLHSARTERITDHSQPLSISTVVGVFERRGECYAYGYTVADHSNMRLARLGGPDACLFDYSLYSLSNFKIGTVVDYYGDYVYMSIKADGISHLQSNFDFVRNKFVDSPISKPIAAFGDSVYWFDKDYKGGITHTDWRSGKDMPAPNLQTSMQKHFSVTTTASLSSATYIDDMRFMVHDNVSLVYESVHIAVFDLRNLTEVCCGYRVTDPNIPPTHNRAQLHLRNRWANPAD